MSRRTKILLLTTSVAAAGVAILLLRVANPMTDSIAAFVLRQKTGLPVTIEGFRVDGRRSWRCDALRIGNPAGFSQGTLVDVEGLSVETRASAPWPFSSDERTILLEEAVLSIEHAGSGDSALGDALGETGAARIRRLAESLETLTVPLLTIRIRDTGAKTETWLRDGSLVLSRADPAASRASRKSRRPAPSRRLEFGIRGSIESARGSGSLEVAFDRPHDRDAFALHVSTDGISLAELMPVLSPWLPGFEASGACDFDLDLSVDRTARRVAGSADGTIANLAWRGWPFAGIETSGEKMIRMRGGFEIDAAKKKVVAETFRLESEALFIGASGEFDAATDSPRSNLDLHASANFDRATLHWGPLLRALLPATVQGHAELRVVPSSERALRFQVVTEGLSAGLPGHRGLAVGNTRIAADVSLAEDERSLVAREVDVETDFMLSKGSATVALPLTEWSRAAWLDLDGTLLTHRAVHPIALWFGSLPLQMNGDVTFDLSLGATPAAVTGSLVFDTADTDFRYDDLREGANDLWNFRGYPMRAEAKFTLPRGSPVPWRALELDLDVRAAKAVVLREELNDLVLPITLRGGVLHAGEWSSGYGGGRARGEMEIRFEEGAAQVDANASVVDVSLQPFPATLVAVATGVLAAPLSPYRLAATNRLSGGIEVKGNGDSMSAVLRSLDGACSLALGPGSIEGSPLLDRWLPASGEGGGRAIESLAANVTFRAGSLVSERVELRADRSRLRLSGGADSRGMIRYVVDPADWLGEKLMARVREWLPKDAIRIEGRFDSPVLLLPDRDAWERLDAAGIEARVKSFVAGNAD